jgi:hypothetical protein
MFPIAGVAVDSFALVSGANSRANFSIGVSFSGPRATAIAVGPDDSLVVKSAQSTVWTAVDVSVTQGGRVVYEPELLAGSKVDLNFTRLRANSVTLAPGAKISFRFPADFAPVHGSKFNVPTVDAMDLSANVSQVQLVYGFYGSPNEQAFRLEAVATHLINRTVDGRSVLVTSLEFFDPMITTASTSTTDATVNATADATASEAPITNSSATTEATSKSPITKDTNVDDNDVAPIRINIELVLGLICFVLWRSL